MSSYIKFNKIPLHLCIVCVNSKQVNTPLENIFCYLQKMHGSLADIEDSFTIGKRVDSKKKIE